MDHQRAEVSLFDDLGFEFVNQLMGENRSSTLRFAVGRAHHQVGLQPVDRGSDERMRRALYELAINAIQHVPRTSTALPWSFVLRPDGCHATWTIGDNGPGLLGRYRKTWRYDLHPDHYGTEDDVLDALVHERLTSFPGDPNAGLGLTIAVREVSRLGGELTLATDGRTFELANGRMERTGRTEATGTTWIARLPMRIGQAA